MQRRRQVFGSKIHVIFCRADNVVCQRSCGVSQPLWKVSGLVACWTHQMLKYLFKDLESDKWWWFLNNGRDIKTSKIEQLNSFSEAANKYSIVVPHSAELIFSFRRFLTPIDFKYCKKYKYQINHTSYHPDQRGCNTYLLLLECQSTYMGWRPRCAWSAHIFLETKKCT